MPPIVQLLLPEQADYQDRFDSLCAAIRSGSITSGPTGVDVRQTVERILAEVARNGDVAAARLGRELDQVELDPRKLRVPEDLITAAHQQAEPAFLELVRSAATNIREYQRHILLVPPEPLVRGGRRLGLRYAPLERVGVYVPGGRAFYPSTVLMTVIPAQVAGVKEIAITSPPTGGEVSPLVLALAAELGVREVYRLGGAVGIAALAYGTETIRPVDKIVGPGNAFVAEAKRQLFGRVGIDCIAGPSEVVIVADESAPPEWVASDLLAQAEHDPGVAILITPSRELAGLVTAELERELGRLSRAAAARQALQRHGAIVVSKDLDAACALADQLAPEHLELVTRHDTRCLDLIRNAGAIFVGAYTPVPVGDYWAGPSHVLPTGGSARFSGPLSSNDFLKPTSIIEYDAASLAADAAGVADFARREGLDAHARAVDRRQQIRS